MSDMDIYTNHLSIEYDSPSQLDEAVVDPKTKLPRSKVLHVIKVGSMFVADSGGKGLKFTDDWEKARNFKTQGDASKELKKILIRPGSNRKLQVFVQQNANSVERIDIEVKATFTSKAKGRIVNDDGILVFAKS